MNWYKTSRALMLIAGDGHTNIFGPDVSSLDPKTWYETGSGQALMNGLRQAKLTAKKIPENEPLTDDDKAWEHFDELKFDQRQELTTFRQGYFWETNNG